MSAPEQKINIDVVQQEELKASLSGVPVTVGFGYFSKLFYVCDNLRSTTYGDELLDSFTWNKLLSHIELMVKIENYYWKSGIALFIVGLVAGGFLNRPVFLGFMFISVVLSAIYHLMLIIASATIQYGIKLLWPLALVVEVDQELLPNWTNTFMEIQRIQRTGIAARINLDNTILGFVEANDTVKLMVYKKRYIHWYRDFSCLFYIIPSSLFYAVPVIWFPNHSSIQTVGYEMSDIMTLLVAFNNWIQIAIGCILGCFGLWLLYMLFNAILCGLLNILVNKFDEMITKRCLQNLMSERSPDERTRLVSEGSPKYDEVNSINSP